MHRRTGRLAAILAATGLMVGAGVATAEDRHDDREASGFSAALSGYQEVPAISTGASGSFTALLDPKHDELHWKLTYTGLESDATQAHVHFGQTGVNGGVSLYLCSNLADAPRGTQRCPDRSAELTGTAEADDVVGPAAQGIAPGELDELAAAMAAGVTYANVHSETFPNGEIRGQIAADPTVTADAFENDRRHDPERHH
jgi:hypothetical protein